MEIEIPTQLYEMILIEAVKISSAVEEMAERCFKNFIKRIDEIAD